MARGDKPYRVYRGGRTRAKMPGLPRPDRGDRRNGRTRQSRSSAASAARPPRRRRFGWGPRIALTVVLLLALMAVWAVTSVLAFRSGVREANGRINAETKAALTPQDGLLLSTASTVLVLGTDHADRTDRSTARRSDSIMLIRTDPGRGRISYLSIPRDIHVDIPGYGEAKINAAYQVGGPALAIRTVRAFTGLPINHVALVDFGSFEDVIDAVGGVDVTVPKPILSKRFDCPYGTAAACARWKGWRFARGTQRMDGRRALVYARIRVNQLDPSESDVTRGERQQQVLDALGRKITRPGTLAKLPWIGDDLLKPIGSDLSAWQFIQLGWRKFRAGKTLHCRLGGDPVTIGGESFISSSEENRNVISMFLGTSAPQPPRPGSGLYGPGCLRR